MLWQCGQSGTGVDNVCSNINYTFEVSITKKIRTQREAALINTQFLKSFSKATKIKYLGVALPCRLQGQNLFSKLQTAAPPQLTMLSIVVCRVSVSAWDFRYTFHRNCVMGLMLTTIGKQIICSQQGRPNDKLFQFCVDDVRTSVSPESITLHFFEKVIF
uniref:Uncharacterized protein n=1 Tax=Ditylenchus dipsaci TaxID=166011 RepID=A0A915E1I6_9BILA